MHGVFGKVPETLAKAEMPGNVHLPCTFANRRPSQRTAPWIYPLGTLCAEEMGIMSLTVTWLCWEMAMSEFKQQSIALWILLMLLLLVPWVLE